MNTSKTFVNRIIHALTDAQERSARKQTRAYLLSLSDRFLDDMGLSRELIKQGPEAWPWRKPEEALGSADMFTTPRTRKTESDAQSANQDLGQRDIEQTAQINCHDTDTKLAA